MALVAISVGAIYGLSQHPTLQAFDASPSQSGAFMTGHVEAIVRDEGGNIIAYRQADNEITTIGLSLLAKQTFLDCNVASQPCDVGPGSNNHTNTTAPFGLAFGYTALACPLLYAGDAVNCPTTGPTDANKPTCGAEFDEVWTSTPELLAGVNSRLNVTVIATFDGLDCDSRQIREAGLWNNNTSPAVTGGQMFARNSFGEVTLTTTDSLELTWRLKQYNA